MKLDSIFVPDTDEIVDIRNYTSSDNKGAQAHDLKEPPTVSAVSTRGTDLRI